MKEILEGLNPEQHAAVTHGKGPLLIVAGAGTGKTRVLTRRIAWLIASKHAKPDQVLGLTFTDKAAQEMEERVDQLVPYGHAPVSIMTFHALGAQLFREQALRLGLYADSEVLSGAALSLFVKQRLFKLPLRRFRPLANPDKHVADLLKAFSRAKDEALTPEAWEAGARALLGAAKTEAEKEAAEEQLELAQAYAGYDTLLHAEGFIDHGDQLLMMLRIFKEHPAVLEKARAAWPWVLVDEFQDTNTVQFELVKLLCPPGGGDNLTVVGDDDQAIYRFRGASLSNILEFRKAYAHAATRVIKVNYRSRQDILNCAYRLIQFNNPDRLEVVEKIDKKLESPNPDQGQGVFYHPYEQLSSELAGISSAIAEAARSGKRTWRDFAVLARTNSQAEEVLGELQFRGIPARFAGAKGLYRREEVRHCLRFLYALARPSDDAILFDFLTDKTYRVPVSDLKELLARARHRNKSLYSLLTRTDLTRAGEDTELDPEAFDRVEKALTDLARYEEIARSQGVAKALYQYLADSGTLAGYLAKGGVESDRQAMNLARFFDRLKTFDKVEKPGAHLPVIEYLQALIEEGDNPPAADADPDADAVSVSTVHMAKGLEWPVVFVAGLEDLHFPMRRPGGGLELPAGLLAAPEDEAAVHRAEERRLFYVAMTRARDELHLSFSRDQGGKKLWKRSPFLQEALNLSKDEAAGAKLSTAEKLARNAARPEHPLVQPLPLHKPGETIRLSYYPLDDYLTCPLKYKIAHGLRLPVPANSAIAYGNVMHKAVQEFNRGHMEGRILGIEDLKKVYDQSWSSEGFYSPEHEKQRYENGLVRLEAFLEGERGAAPPVHIELSFEFRLGPAEVLSGRMDRVDRSASGEISICDYKTSNKHDQKEADAEVKKSLQLAIYAMAWEAREGRLPDWLELYFLESGLKARLKPDAAYMEAKKAEIRRAFEGIRAQDFAATPDFNGCKYCAYNRLCPESAAQ